MDAQPEAGVADREYQQDPQPDQQDPEPATDERQADQQQGAGTDEDAQGVPGGEARAQGVRHRVLHEGPLAVDGQLDQGAQKAAAVDGHQQPGRQPRLSPHEQHHPHHHRDQLEVGRADDVAQRPHGADIASVLVGEAVQVACHGVVQPL